MLHVQIDSLVVASVFTLCVAVAAWHLNNRTRRMPAPDAPNLNGKVQENNDR